METYLTVEETAETLRVSIDSVRRWLRSGKLRGNRYGRVWRVPVSELRRTGHLSSTGDSYAAEPQPEEAQVHPKPDDGPHREMKAFLQMADGLAPLIAAGQKQPLTATKVSAALDTTREERDQELATHNITSSKHQKILKGQGANER